MISPYTGCINRSQGTTTGHTPGHKTGLNHDSKRPWNHSKSKFTHRPQSQATKPAMEPSQISLEISTKSAPKTSPKIWTQTEKQPKLQQSWAMDHNVSCRGPIWVIQKPNIKFTDAATTSMKDLSPNSLCFPIKNRC